jgi:CrcB protein
MSRTTERRLHIIETGILIAIGGFAGANLRQFLAVVLPGLSGTVAANLLGCLALGFLAYEAERIGVLAEETGYVAATGFLSSFTTYSTFALETVQASLPMSLVNVIATYGGGFVAVLIGRTAAKALEED